MSTNDIVIGIDLGTTNSCAAVFLNDKFEVIPTKAMKNTTPSIVCYLDKKTRVVGDDAKQASLLSVNNFQNTITAAKRLIGRSSNDPVIEDDKKMWPFEVLTDKGRPEIKIPNRHQPLIVEEISAAVLSSLKADAEAYLKQSITKCVITVPAYFTNSQRQATILAGKIAGFEVLRILNEPTAAAYTYGLTKTLKGIKKHTVFVFDLGGGTFDISILEVNDGNFNVIMSKGDSHLGGEDIDNRIILWFIQELNRQYKIRFDPIKDKEKMLGLKRKLAKYAQTFKHTLASQTISQLTIDSIIEDPAHPDQYLSLTVEMTRDVFNTTICKNMIERCMKCVQDAMTEAKATAEDIDAVLLVGGSTRLPAVVEELSKLFPSQKIAKEVNPDEAVAKGAAILGALVSTNPKQKISQISVKDVTSLPIGVQLRDNRLSVLVDKAQPIPCKNTKNYTNSRDGQTKLTFTICEGEDPQADKNDKLGVLTVPLPNCKAREANIDVTFDIDSDGILHVTTVNKKTNEEKNLDIVYSQGAFTPEDINAFVAEEAYLQTLPPKEAARESFSQTLTVILDLIENDPDVEIENISSEQREAMIQRAQEYQLWLKSIDFFDTAITKEMFSDREQHLKEDDPEVWEAFEDAFYMAQ